MWGVIFGAVGLAYFVYGKKQQRFVPLFCFSSELAIREKNGIYTL